MKRACTFLALSVLMVVSLFAQWTKPAAPASVPLQTGETLYLYNRDADAFFLGANDWGTRASVSSTKGYKVWVEKYDLDDISYYLADSVETKSTVMYTFIDAVDAIYVDREKTSTNDKLFTFEEQGDGTYRIGLSPANTTFTPERYPQAYLGIIPEMNDTRIYLCDTSSYYPPFYDPEKWQNVWYFVAPAEYSAYIDKKVTYEAAVALKAAIDKALAENAGIDISAIEAVYNNGASTVAELTKAAEDLVWLVVEFQTARVSPETPADYTAYITNPSYANNDNTGWKGTTPSFQTYGNAEFYSETYDGYQAIENLPNGIYRVSVDAYYRAGNAPDDEVAYAAFEEGDDSLCFARLYAATSSMNDMEQPIMLASSQASAESLGGNESTNSYGYIPNDMATAATYMAAGKYHGNEVLCYVSDGKLTIGLRKTHTIGGDWTLFDNWKLYYLGDGDAALNYFVSDYLGKSFDYEAYFEENDDVYHHKAAYEAYLTTRNALVEASDAAAIGSAIAAFDAAVVALEASIDAYALYYAKYQEAEAYMESVEAVYGDAMYLLSDYLYMEEEPSELYPNGTGQYILAYGLLTAEQVTAETAFLDKLLADAIANALQDGADCTVLLKNPSFAEEGGWVSQPGVTFPTNGLAIGEGPNMVFDIHQEIKNLQNGLYEFTVNACYQAADYTVLTGEEQYKAYTYINGYQKLMNSVLDDPAAASAHAEDYNFPEKGYVPGSSASAYQAFVDGRYVQTVYGLVTDGTMRLGIRNDLRYADGSRAWWTGAKLIFRAKNVEILGEVIAATVPEAQALLANKAGKPELDALTAAIAAAEAAADETRYDALVDLKQAMEEVVASTDTYLKLHTAIGNLGAAIDEYAAAASAEAVKTAETLHAEVLAAYEAATYSNAEAAAKVEECNLAVVQLKIPDMSGDDPVDVSSLIINNNFDPAKGDKNTGVIEGWVTSAMNGYKQNTVSYNRAAIDLYQDLVGLPAGKYKVTVQTYYRAGYYDEEWARKESGEETHLTTLYAATADQRYEVKVKNLYEDAAVTNYGVNCYTLANGMFAPDGTSSTVEFFKQGHYLNELEFVVGEDGKARIGLSKTEILSNDYEVVGPWKLYFLGEEEGAPEPVDMTSLIVNNNFDPAKGDKNTGVIEGWTTSAMNGYKQNTVSYNRAAIDLYQDLVGLPEGTYEVTVHTYYRAGYYDEEWALYQEDPEKTHLTTLYATTSEDKYEVKVMNLLEGASETNYGVNCYTLPNGMFAPDGTTPTVEFFNQGHYLNKLQFVVGADGKARIGLSKTEIISNDYEVVGAWHLYYLGKNGGGEGIEEVESAAPVLATEIYTLDGRRLGSPQPGINIFRIIRTDGTVEVTKVMVR